MQYTVELPLYGLIGTGPDPNDLITMEKKLIALKKNK